MEIIKRTNRISHVDPREIERQRDRHHKDLIQPREGGEVNPEYVKEYGTKNLNPTNKDIRQMWKKDSSLARVLIKKREQQFKQGKCF